MTRVKICGITTLDDALVAVRAGAHALGFVFADSPRRVTPGAVREIARALPPFVTTVGVFVDQPSEQVEAVLDETGLHMAQLHGEEPPDDCAAIRARVVKRIRVDGQSPPEAFRAEFNRYDVAGYLLDPGSGSGCSFDWTRLAEVGVAGSRRTAALDDRLIIAGGLDPENVSHAITLLRPHAVDVCTGVEAAPGRKDARKIQAFMHAMERADAVYAA
jgi:phosphoribosylanthranilate isomerase